MHSALAHIALLAHPSGADIAVGGHTNLLHLLTKPVDATFKVGEMGTATLRFGSSAAYVASLGGMGFLQNQTMRFDFVTDPSLWWRIDKTTLDRKNGLTVTLWPYWSMLASRKIRTHRDPSTFVDLTDSLVEISAQDALNVVLGEHHNRPSFFLPGTVHPAIAGVKVSLEMNGAQGDTHLTLIWELCKQLAPANQGRVAAFTSTWSAAQHAFIVDIVPWEGMSTVEYNLNTPQPQSRRIEVPTSGEDAGGLSNLVTFKREEGGRDQFNRGIPVGGLADQPVSIGDATWTVHSARYIGGGLSEITLHQFPLQEPLRLGQSGPVYFGYAGLYYPFVQKLAANAFVVQGNVTGLTAGRFVIDADGSQLVYLDMVGASGDDVREATIRFDDVVPYANLLERYGVSHDMSTWVADPDSQNALLPVGWGYFNATTKGYPTVVRYAKADHPAYVRYGPYGCHIQFGAVGQGFRVLPDLLKLEIAGNERWFSFTVNLSVLAGRVRVHLVDEEGIFHPQGSGTVEYGGGTLRALQSGGNEVASGTGYLLIEAIEAGTIIVLDSANVTNSVGPYAYQGRMGPEELWMVGLEYMLKEGGKHVQFSGDFIDATHLIAGQETVAVGSFVTLRPRYDDVQKRYDELQARVETLQLKWSQGQPGDPFPLVKRIKLGSKTLDIAYRLQGTRSGGTLGSVPRTDSTVKKLRQALAESYRPDTIAMLAQDYESGEEGISVIDVHGVDGASGTSDALPKGARLVLPVQAVDTTDTTPDVDQKDLAFYLTKAAPAGSRQLHISASKTSAIPVRISAKENDPIVLSARYLYSEQSQTAERIKLYVTRLELADVERRIEARDTAYVEEASDAVNGALTAGGLPILVARPISELLPEHHTDLQFQSAQLTVQANSINALVLDITANDDDIDVIFGDLLIKAGELQLLTGIIDDNGLTAATAIVSRVSQNETDILSLISLTSSQGTSIASLELEVQNHDGRITTAEANIVTALVNSSTNATAISALNLTVTDHGNRLSSAEADLTTVIANTDTNTTSIASLNISVTDQGSRLLAAEASLSAVITDTETNATSIASLTVTTTNQEGRLSTAEADLSSTINNTSINTNNIASLTTTVIDHGNRLSSAEADLATVISNANTNASSILSLNTSVSNHETRITATEASLTSTINNTATNTTSISVLNLTTANHEGRLTTAETDLSSTISNTSTNTTNIASLTTTVTDHGTRLSSAEASLTATINDTGVNASSISVLNLTAANHESRITTAEASLSSTITNTSTNTTNVSSLTTTVTDHGNRISSAETDLAAVITDTDTNTTSIGSINTTVTDYGNRITSVETDLTSTISDTSANTTAISALDSTVISHGGRITAAETDITSLVTDTDDNTSAISGLQTSVIQAEGDILSLYATTVLKAEISGGGVSKIGMLALDAALPGSTAKLLADVIDIGDVESEINVSGSQITLNALTIVNGDFEVRGRIAAGETLDVEGSICVGGADIVASGQDLLISAPLNWLYLSGQGINIGYTLVVNENDNEIEYNGRVLYIDANNFVKAL